MARPGVPAAATIRFASPFRRHRRRTRTDVADWAGFRIRRANYTYTAHGRKCVGTGGAASPVAVFVRDAQPAAHGDGVPGLKWGSTNVYRSRRPAPRYDWTIVDRIIDTYLERKISRSCNRLHARGAVVPTAALSALLEARRQLQRLYTGWSYPPND